MKSKQFSHSILLFITALVWGIAFVAQSSGGDAVGPFSYNSIRSILGGIALLPVIKFLDAFGFTKNKPTTKEDWRNLLTGGCICGTLLCIASNFQQVGINLGTTAGKAGFITACYILLVPVISIFLKKHCGLNVWIGVFIALIGLYLLCMDGKLTFAFSDCLVLVCAIVFSCHILVVDHFSPIVDGVRMSCIQFLVCGIITAVPMIFIEIPKQGFPAWSGAFNSLDAWIPILYGGLMSCGVAYTLQIVGQEGMNPTIASLIMSFESVFSVIAGWIILHEAMGPRELTGCVLIFAAIILAQLPEKSFHQT